MVPRNPFAPAVLTSTGAIFGPSAQTVANAVGLLSTNLVAVMVAMNPCIEKGEIDDVTMSEWEIFTEFVDKFVEANKEPSWMSLDLSDLLAQVDQIQGQLEAWKTRLSKSCAAIAQVPDAPTRANTDGSLFSVPTQLIVGGAIVLGLLIVWKVK